MLGDRDGSEMAAVVGSLREERAGRFTYDAGGVGRRSEVGKEVARLSVESAAWWCSARRVMCARRGGGVEMQTGGCSLGRGELGGAPSAPYSVDD